MSIRMAPLQCERRSDCSIFQAGVDRLNVLWNVRMLRTFLHRCRHKSAFVNDNVNWTSTEQIGLAY